MGRGYYNNFEQQITRLLWELEMLHSNDYPMDLGYLEDDLEENDGEFDDDYSSIFK